MDNRGEPLAAPAECIAQVKQIAVPTVGGVVEARIDTRATHPKLDLLAPETWDERIQLAQRLTADDLMNAANALGFNADPSLGTTAADRQL